MFVVLCCECDYCVVVPANAPLFNGNCMLYDVSRSLCVSVPCFMISFGNG